MKQKISSLFCFIMISMLIGTMTYILYMLANLYIDGEFWPRHFPTSFIAGQTALIAGGIISWMLYNIKHDIQLIKIIIFFDVMPFSFILFFYAFTGGLDLGFFTRMNYVLMWSIWSFFASFIIGLIETRFHIITRNQ